MKQCCPPPLKNKNKKNLEKKPVYVLNIKIIDSP